MNRIEKLIAELCPDGVEWKKLGEVANIDLGTQLNKTEMLTDGLYPVYNGGINPSGFYNDYNTAENSIAISQGGASAGYVNYVSTKFWAGAHCFVVKPIEDNIINNRFLYFYLKNIQEKIQEAKHGAGIPGLNGNKLKSLPIPLPPLPIQEEIVKILDTFTALEAELELKLQAELEARKKQYEYYRNTLLTPVEHNGRWYLNGVEVVWKKLGEVCKVFTGGEPPKNFIRGDSPTIIYKYPIYGNGIDVYGYSDTYEIDKDAVTISSIGANTGKIYFRNAFFTPIIRLKVLIPIEENLLSKYIYYYLSSINISSKKSSVPNMNSNDAKKITIPIPPLSEQERIVAILDKFDALVNDISQGLPAEIEARRKQYEYYRNKLLNFRGNS